MLTPVRPSAGRWLAAALITVAAVVGVAPDIRAYVTTGRSWAGSVIPYYINTSNAPVSANALISAVQQAAAPWSHQTRANIQLAYAGTTSGSSLTFNYKNEVFLRNEASSAVASTYWWYDGTGRLVDFDTVMYAGGTQFFVGSGCNGYGVYVENVMVHEFGHGLGLAHSPVAGATMYPSMAGYCDRTQLTLDPDDIAGIESVYPSGSVTPPPPPPPATPLLTVVLVRKGKQDQANLSWSGLTGSSVTVRRNGSVIATTTNDGQHIDSSRTPGLFTYAVCATQSSTCTPAVTVSF